MKKLIHLKSFQEFDPVQWAQEEPVQEADRLADAFANTSGNVFDQDEEKWGRTSRTDKWGDDKEKRGKEKEKTKKPKAPGRVGMAYKDAKNALWKGYKSDLHPGFQKLRKYLKGKDGGYFD